MKTLKYSVIFLIITCVAVFAGCKNKKVDEHGHSHETHTENSKTEVHEEHNDKGEAEGDGEHEELPDNIVEMSAEQIKVAGIHLGKVEMRAVNGVIKANGIVTAAPQNMASISVPMGGFIKSSTLLPGSAVKKGQTLATIENTEFIELQQNYFDTKNKFEFAEAEYKRHSELYKEDVYSQKNVQQTTSEYRILKAKLKGMEQKLLVIGINPANLTEETISATIAVKSPINGYVKSANISMGKYVSPTDVLFEIVNTNNLLLELSLFEKDATGITNGQVVHFSINNESHEHKATIYQAGKSINTDKTYKVYAAVQQPCPNVLPGMYVLAHIEKNNRMVNVVPSDAVVSFDNKYYIFAFEKDKKEAGKPFTEYRIIEVKKGETNNGFTEVQFPEGLNIKDIKIVIKGAYKLLSAKKNAGEMTC